MKLLLVTNTMHICTLVNYKNIFMINPLFLALMFSQSFLYKCNKDRPYYATQNLFFQYHEGFNFVTGKTSAEIKDVHVTIPNGAPSITQSDIRNGYVIPQESSVYRKYEKSKLFTKRNWFGAVRD